MNKKEIELKHDLEMEKLEYIRDTEFKLLEKQWELAHRRPMQLPPVPDYYPQEPEEKVTSQSKYGRKKKK